MFSELRRVHRVAIAYGMYSIIRQSAQSLAASQPVADGKPVPAGTSLLVPQALNGENLPVENSPQFRKTLEVLREQGAIMVPVNLRLVDASRYDELLLSDVKEELSAYLANRPGLPVKSLTELITFNKERDGTEVEHQPVLKEVSASSLAPEQRKTLWDALIEDFRDTVDTPISTHNLDAMVSDFATNSYFGTAIAGYPGITLPSGTDDDGLPTGAYFFLAPVGQSPRCWPSTMGMSRRPRRQRNLGFNRLADYTP